MTISVVICAYTLDRFDDLAAAVASCIEQTTPALEIVLVIDYNDLLLARAAREFAGVHVVANTFDKGLSGARNTGVSLTTSDAVAFLDDDARAEPSWLEQLQEPLKDEAVAGVGGWVTPRWDGASPAWFPPAFYWALGCSYDGLPPSGQAIRNPIGASMLIRRRVFDTVGGFSPGLGRIGRNALGCEETELCIRYTSVHPTERFVLAREAVVHHHVPPSRLTLKYFFLRCWAEGISKAAVASLVGFDAGLAAERRHVARALPRSMASDIRLLARDSRGATQRLALTIAGTLVTAAGLLRGQWALWRGSKRDDAPHTKVSRTIRDGTWPPRSDTAS